MAKQQRPPPATPPQGKSPAQGKLRSEPSQNRGRLLITPAKPKPSPTKPRNRSAKSPKSPGSQWQTWQQVAIGLDGLPLDTTLEHLWQELSPKGAIVWIEISEARQGRRTVSATVIFEPPPKRAFWQGDSVLVKHPDVRKFPHGLVLSAKLLYRPPRRIFTHDGSERRNYPVKMTVRLAKLDFGSMTGPAAMVATNSITAPEPSRDMELELDVAEKRLTVYFSAAHKTEGWTGFRQYRFTVDFSDINKLYQTVSDDGSVSWVLPLPRPPRYYWKMDDVHSTFPSDSRFWSANHLWYRATNIVQDSDAPMRHPVALHSDIRDPAYIDIGRLTTFRLVLAGRPQRDNAKTQQQLQMALGDFNVSIVRCDDFQVQRGGRTMWDCLDDPPVMKKGQASALLGMPVSPIIQVSFDVRYQLEVCVSRGILNENTVTADFLQKLASLEPRDAVRRLEYLVDQHEPLSDPMQLFANPDAASYMSNTNVPYYCTLVRKAVITPTAIRYNSPSVEASNRVLRKYDHMQDRFLRVQFVEETERGRCSINKQNDEVGKRVLRTLYQGIRIGDRLYEFLGFGSSQLRENGAYFFCPTEHTSCDDIRQWMGDLNHIRVVAKYAARLGQCFSTTREIRGIFKPKTQRIADIERNGHCFSDGVGIISQFLARFIMEEMPLDVLDKTTAFQFRMGGCKGVLAVWPQAKGMEVLVRDSQEKFKAESNGLEIVRCATFSTATLNRQTITILESLGVPTRAFERLLDQQIKDYQRAMVDSSAAVELLTKYVDEKQSTLVLAELLKAGFKNGDIQEPFTVNLLNLWRSWSLKLLKEKARLQVAQGAFVLGCVDETGTLRGHLTATEGSPDKNVHKLPQIFLQLSGPTRNDPTTVIKGVCIIGRNPSLHPGDIRVVQAVDNPKLRHLRDVVVFPSTGDRPLPNMLSGGDLDGDDFFVMWDPDLIPKQWNFPPMNYAGPKPVQLKRDVNVDDIRNFFVKYMKNDVLALIATSHLAFSDMWSPKEQLCLHLADLHSKAVDYAKTGEAAEFSTKLQPSRWPHFMEKRKTYHSKKALGVIYDKVVKQTIQFMPDWEHAFDQRIMSRYTLDSDTVKAARKIKTQYDISVRRILAQHDVGTEFELYTSWAMSGPAVGSDYKRQEVLGREYDALKWRFREQCYKAAGDKDGDKLDRFVAAMYKVTEEEVKIALYEHHGEQTEDTSGKMTGEQRLEAKSMPLISFPWLFHWVMIRIATGD